MCIIHASIRVEPFSENRFHRRPYLPCRQICTAVPVVDEIVHIAISNFKKCRHRHSERRIRPRVSPSQCRRRQLRNNRRRMVFRKHHSRKNIRRGMRRRKITSMQSIAKRATPVQIVVVPPPLRPLSLVFSLVCSVGFHIALI